MLSARKTLEKLNECMGVMSYGNSFDCLSHELKKINILYFKFFFRYGKKFNEILIKTIFNFTMRSLQYDQLGDTKLL
jgi:hypothetical protein